MINSAKKTTRKIVLKLSNISFNYGNTLILKNVSLNLHQGEIIALQGPSGSGKTSLLMVASGLERPKSGKVFINDELINDYNEKQLAQLRREKLQIIFQAFHLLADLDALQNVSVGLDFASSKNIEAKAKSMLASVGLKDRLTHYPGQLSGGEQQRVAIARAFAMQPAIILADEPTGNLDDKTSEQIIKLLFNQVRENNSACIIITHNSKIAAKCDKIYKLKYGRLG